MYDWMTLFCVKRKLSVAELKSDTFDNLVDVGLKYSLSFKVDAFSLRGEFHVQ